MKKNLFFYAAAAALMLTACTNEDDVVQVEQTVTTAENDGAVGFDVYVPQATTRSGRVNVMTNSVLQQTGFGIFGYQTDDAGYATGKHVANYMWNQRVYFNKTPQGWYYAPLKYWPNETNQDSQTDPTNPAGMPDQTAKDHMDRLTFFAYAPWVDANTTNNRSTQPVNSNIEAPANVGIGGVSDKNGNVWIDGGDVYASSADAMIAYNFATNPDQSVDLLWGVAPAGGLTYTSVAKNVTVSGTVNEGVVSIKEGMPLINLIKPAVNTNLKFMFQHALARLGVKVVLASDQVAAGGVFDYANTKVTIEKIEISSANFGTKGILSLNNTAKNEANWVKKNKADGTGDPGVNPILTIEKGKGLAPHLIYDAAKATASPKEQQIVTGVTADLADAIKVSAVLGNSEYKYSTKQTKPAYSPTTPYFAGEFDNATPTYATYSNWAPTTDWTYLQQFTTDNVATNNKAYTDITDVINTKYPNATVWKNIYRIYDGNIIEIDDGNKAEYASATAYRKVGNVYTPTGHEPEIGDYVFKVALTTVPEPDKTTDYYTAYPNYFMVIPYNVQNASVKVKITYYVSTTDDSVKDKVVYTKNEVEKDIVLPHLKNGVAYNLKLILGMTSVKVEAEAADWETTEGVINLPQNTAE